MNVIVTTIGVLIGWTILLGLPWLLTDEKNPFASPASIVILVPLLIPLLVVVQPGTEFPRFLNSRLAWIAANVSWPKATFLLVGFATGLLFSIPSAVIISLSAVLLFTQSVWAIGILIIVGLVHLACFVFSFFAAHMWLKSWGRRLFRYKRSKRHASSNLSNYTTSS